MWQSEKTKIMRYSFVWTAVGFALLLMLFEWITVNTGFATSLGLVLIETSNVQESFLRWGVQILLIFTVTSCFVLAALISRSAVKVIYLLLFTVIVFVEYGYQNSTNNYMVLHDVYSALDSWSNWDNAIVAYINWLALVPVLGFAVLLLLFKQVKRYGLGLLTLVILLIFGINITLIYYANFDAKERQLKLYTAGPSISLHSFFQLSTHLALEQLALTQFSRHGIPFQSQVMPDNNIVFIIDESIRYDHLSLNDYQRSTTPFLEQLAGQQYLYNWGRSAAGSSCSFQSGALLLTGVSDLPDEQHALQLWPSIFQYAQAMNYTVHYFDAESDTIRFPLTTEDLQYIDHYVTHSQLGIDSNTDLQAASHIADILHNSTGNFITIFKRGAHFPYGETYPKQQTIWSPVMADHEIVSNDRSRLINTYDNAVHHNINNFFAQLLDDSSVLSSTVILYTSDHGEKLGEDDTSQPHCGRTLAEAGVPLMLISDQPWPIDTDFKAGHRNMFSTLLDFMHFPEAERSYSYPLSLLKATAKDSQPRSYYVGAFFGYGDYVWLPFD